MTDAGERPDDVPEDQLQRLDIGETVYDEGGEALGEIRGFDSGGFYVTMREGFEAMSVEHARSGKDLGEAELMWRCTECGEMGRIADGVPDECPNCGSPRESLMYWTED